MEINRLRAEVDRLQGAGEAAAEGRQAPNEEVADGEAREEGDGAGGEGGEEGEGESKKGDLIKPLISEDIISKLKDKPGNKC